MRPRVLLGGFCLLVCADLLAPIVIVVGASFNAGAFLTFPPRGLSLRWFAAFLGNQVFIDAIVRSLWLALVATAISGVVGVAAALACFGAEAAFSIVWLKHFQFGPAEWLWRSLTYGQRQPMRRPSVSPESETVSA